MVGVGVLVLKNINISERNKSNEWADEQKEFLKNNYAGGDRDFLINHLAHSWYGIMGKASCLGLKKYVINQDFFKSWSSDMAYVLGFIMSDGGVSKCRSIYMLGIYQKDTKILHAINRVMDSTYHVDDYYGTLVICNQELCHDLIKLGVTPRKSLTLQFPDVPDEYLRDFVRGYFDGDGGTGYQNYGNKYLVPNIRSSDYFLKSLRDILSNHDIKSNLRSDGSRLRLYILGGRKGYLKFFKFIYHDGMGDLCLRRKYQEFMNYFKANKVKEV